MTDQNQMTRDICDELINTYYSNIIYSLPYYLIINLYRGRVAIYL